MRTLKIILLIELISIFIISCSDSATTKKDDKTTTEPKMENSPKSIPSETNKNIGSARISIKYTAPAVRGRQIWGALVPYDRVWVTGAHNATSLEISKPFIVGNTEVPAGKYAFFTIPSKEEWTIILNKNWDQHQADEYNQSDDVVRIKVKPKQLEQPVERLNYEIDQAGEKLANIYMNWEKLQVSFKLRLLD